MLSINDVLAQMGAENYEVKKDFSSLNSDALRIYVDTLAMLHRLQNECWIAVGGGDLDWKPEAMDDAERVPGARHWAEVYETGEDCDALADKLADQINFIKEQMGVAIFEIDRRHLQGGEDSKPVGNCETLGLGYAEKATST